jgi:hypothetical protein
METYRTWIRLFELLPYYSWIVDRFHLSTRMYQLMANHKDYDFKWLEESLLPLGFRMVFCTRSADSFAAAREQRIVVSGKPEQYDDLNKFVHEQALMQKLIKESILPVLNLDVSDNNIPRAVGTIADWMEQTGGLYR